MIISVRPELLAIWSMRGSQLASVYFRVNTMLLARPTHHTTTHVSTNSLIFNSITL